MISFSNWRYYIDDFYKDTPVITSNTFGKGEVYYIGTQSSEEFYYDFIRNICIEKKISTALYNSISYSNQEYKCEIINRYTAEFKYTFILNHENDGENIKIPFDAIDLISGKEYYRDDILFMDKKQVAILKSC